MKRILVIVLSLAAIAGLGFLLVRAFLTRHAEQAQESGAAESAAAEPKVKQNGQGEVVVTLDTNSQQRVALRVAPLTRANLSREVKAYGHVLDPAPLAALASELASAQAATKASRAEFDRLTQLQQQDNASLRALQTAEAAARHDQLQVQSARDRLRLSWGNAILERRNLAGLVRSLTSMEQAFVRLDLPAGATVTAAPTGARLVTLSGGDQTVAAEFFGPAPAIDPQIQGQGFLFLVKTSSPGLTAGAAVTGFVQLAGEPVVGVVVPRGAVVRYAGRGWIYLRTSDSSFTRHEIALDHPTETGWFLTAGVAPGDPVVVNGAQTLLAEELTTGNFVTGQRD